MCSIERQAIPISNNAIKTRHGISQFDQRLLDFDINFHLRVLLLHRGSEAHEHDGVAVALLAVEDYTFTTGGCIFSTPLGERHTAVKGVARCKSMLKFVPSFTQPSNGE
jgi:hypothetical protein